MKKAQFGLNLVMALLIISTLLLVYYNYYLKPLKTISLVVDDQVGEVDASAFLLTYLKTPAGDQTIADLIILYKESNENNLLIEHTDQIVELLYGPSTAWTLTIDNKILSGKNKAKANPIDYSTKIPSKQDIEVNLKIYQ